MNGQDRRALPKIVGVIDEEPLHFQTWSGSSRYFFEALERRQTLVAALSAEPSLIQRRICQLKAFTPNLQKWKFSYHISTALFGQMSKVAKSQIDSVDEYYDVILQIGAWYDLIEEGKLNVSYHDGNLATRLASPFGFPKVSSRNIDKALAFECELYNRMDMIFPMSRWLANSFISDFGVPAKKVKPVGAGINLARILDTSDRSYDGKVLLMVGKDFYRKGGDTLLEAFELVKKSVPEARLRLIGPELDNLPSGVECLGFLSKANDAHLDILLQEYKAASVFVLPSLYEPFGIAFVEAMAHRLPCVGTNICAMPEIILDEETGYVVPPENPSLLAEKLVSLLLSEEKCREFGEAGYQRYKDNYTWDIVAERIEEELCKLRQEI